MRHSIIEALFNGEIAPYEQRKPHSPERMALEQKIKSEKRHLAEKLPEEDVRRLEVMEELYNEAAFYGDLDIFSRGFTLGALLIMEVMTESK